MKTRDTDLGLRRLLARRLFPATVLIALVISLVPPMAYYLLQRRGLDRAATVHAEEAAEKLKDLRLESGPVWRDRPTRFDDLFGALARKGALALTVLDDSGRVLVERGAGAAPWWMKHRAEGAAPVTFNGRRLGTVRVELSQGRLLTVTLWLVGASTLFGASLAIFVYRYPVRIVGAMDGRIQNLVAELRRAHAELVRRAVDLHERDAELDSFVFSVSHDLKTPLVSLEGLAGALLADYGEQLGGGGRHYLERLQANVRQMERLIEDVLALSRVGRESRVPGAVDLAEVMDGVLAELADRIGERGVKVTVEELGALWGIRTQVAQVMTNLLSNALKYMGETAPPMVEVGTIDRGEFVECYVRDNGIGIDPAYHGKIFEVFQRLNEVEVEGTGVGLAIVKKIVEGVGGRVWVESAKGQGATFRFTWPAGEADEVV